jgi:hypothetical protein
VRHELFAKHGVDIVFADPIASDLVSGSRVSVYADSLQRMTRVLPVGEMSGSRQLVPGAIDPCSTNGSSTRLRVAHRIDVARLITSD